MLFMLQYAALAVPIAYIFLSITSAFRMYFFHGRYTHIEFGALKWRNYGEWAPRRLRTLMKLRRWALVCLLLWFAIVLVRSLHA